MTAAAALPATLTLEKITALSGAVQLVGSKSLTNRALLLSALAQGTTTLRNILRSDDSKVMLAALCALGVTITEDASDPTTVIVEGIGGPFATADQGELELFLGNAGTAMRPLCAALALSNGTYRLVGEPRMYERPIGVLVDALRALGAKIDYLGTEGYPPLRITGIGALSATGVTGTTGAGAATSSVSSGSLTLQVAGNTSSQFISALLMVGSLLPQPMRLEVVGELISKPYVHLTCELLQRFGIEVVNHDFKYFDLKPTAIKSPGFYLVEGDASGATYFLAGAAIAGDVTVYGVGANSIQGDAKFIELLERMGAVTEIGSDYMRVKQAPQLHGLDSDLNDMPDAAMTLVPMALFTDSPVILRNIESWRVKETDRIEAMATEMRKLGCEVEVGRDFIAVNGNTAECRARKERGEVPVFDTYNDHRMAMCMSLCALDRTVAINDPACCKKTFPDYFERLAQITVR